MSQFQWRLTCRFMLIVLEYIIFSNGGSIPTTNIGQFKVEVSKEI